MSGAMKRRCSGLMVVSGVPVVSLLDRGGEAFGEEGLEGLLGFPDVGDVEALVVEPGHVHLTSGRRNPLPVDRVPHGVVLLRCHVCPEHRHHYSHV